jgi:hypothetical protein
MLLLIFYVTHGQLKNTNEASGGKRTHPVHTSSWREGQKREQLFSVARGQLTLTWHTMGTLLCLL